MSGQDTPEAGGGWRRDSSSGQQALPPWQPPQRPTSVQTPIVEHMVHPPPAPRPPRWAWLRTWSHRRTVIAVAIVAGLLGVGISAVVSAGTESSQRKEISTATARVAALTTSTSTLSGQVSDLQAQRTTARHQAADAQTVAEAKAAQDYAGRLAQVKQQGAAAQAAGEAKAQADYAPRLAKVKQRADAVSARETAVAAREVAVTGAEHRAAANTIAGTGTFLVGQDIRAGTYRAAAQKGCYWERDNDTAGSLDSIIANDNADGPVVVTIDASDRAFKTSGCADFHKIG